MELLEAPQTLNGQSKIANLKSRIEIGSWFGAPNQTLPGQLLAFN